MATDPQLDHFRLQHGSDYLDHEALFQNFVDFQDTSTDHHISWSHPVYPFRQLTNLGLHAATDALDVAAWNPEAPPAQYIASNETTTHNPLLGLAKQAGIVGEDGNTFAPNLVASTANARRELKHPTPADWTRWKPTIAEMYKHGTARVILKKFHMEGFHVT